MGELGILLLCMVCALGSDSFSLLLMIALTGRNISSAEGASIVCYECNGKIGMPCGLVKGRWTVDYLEAGSRLCDAGMCYTYINRADSKAPFVSRGCGQLDCSKLPLEYNVTLECGDIVNAWKGHNAMMVNRSLVFDAQSSQREKASGSLDYCIQDRCTGLLQYCDEDRCNSGPVHIPGPPSTSQEKNINLATSCLACNSYANQSCGRGIPEGGPLTEVNCTAGYCFTYLWVEQGKPPMAMRGCGGINCIMVPGASGSSGLCDENNILVPLNTTAGHRFNENRSFNQPFGSGRALAGTVEYCNNKARCNSNLITNFKLNGSYLTDRDAAEVPIADSANKTTATHSGGKVQRKNCVNVNSGSVRMYNDLEMVFTTIARDLSQLDGMEINRRAKLTEQIKAYVLDKAYEMYQKACTETGEVYIRRMDYLSND